MGYKPGTPLPATLDGVIVERPIKIDRALLYLIGGALEWLTDKEPLEETGTLTVDAARLAFSNMLWDFYHEVVPVDTNPIGMIQLWPIDTPPENWLICDGTSTHLKADYPDFAALIEGTTWDEDETHFSVPDLRDRAAIGPGTFFPTIGALGGEREHTLTESEMPAHNHNFSSGTAAGTGAYVVRANSTLASAAHVTTTDGGGQAHNNMQPFTVLQYIIRVK